MHSYQKRKSVQRLIYEVSNNRDVAFNDLHAPNEIIEYHNTCTLHMVTRSFALIISYCRMLGTTTLHRHFIWLHIYPPITRKRSMRYTSSLRSCRPSVYHTKIGGIPLSAFPNGTTSKLAGLFSALSLQC